MSKSISKSSINLLQMSLSTSTGGTSPLSLGGPVELTDFGGSFLLDVVIGSASFSAEGMGLVVSFTK